MPEPLPVTRDDMLAAHRAIHARPDGLEHVEVPDPTDDSHGERWMTALGRALETDRKRVIERST